MASDVGSTVNDMVAHEHPQSCLALVAKLWQLETEMTQRIRHAAEWPQVVIPDRTEAGYKPQRVKFTGRTQTRMESLLTEAATWKTELEQLKKTVLPMFSELELPKPDGSEFQLRCVAADNARAVSGKTNRVHEFIKKADEEPEYTDDEDGVRPAVARARRTVSRLVGTVLQAAFDQRELPLNRDEWEYAIELRYCGCERSVPHRIYPPYPVRSPLDLQNWLLFWVRRCRLPAKLNVVAPPPIPGKPVTVEAPKERPPLEHYIEPGEPCKADDLNREMRNCRRALFDWSVTGCPIWEVDSQDLNAAEIRAGSLINWLRENEFLGEIVPAKTSALTPLMKAASGDQTLAGAGNDTTTRNGEADQERVSYKTDARVEPKIIFQPKGEGYFIQGCGESGQFSAVRAKGLHLLHRLVQTPGVPVLMTELLWAGNRHDGDRYSKQPAIDGTGVSKIQAKHRQLKVEIEEADDPNEKSRLHAELIDLEEHTKGIWGKTGRKGKRKVRDINNPNDKYRPKIASQIKTVCKQLDRADCKNLAQHFADGCSASGDSYIYEPGPQKMGLDIQKKQ